MTPSELGTDEQVPSLEDSKSLKDPNNEKLDPDLQKILVDLVRKCEKEDESARQAQLRMWKRNDKFWHGIQYIFWSESEQEWLSPNDPRLRDKTIAEMDEEVYDYVFNIYRAHGEAIIAALSAEIPSVRFPPDDADNDDDNMTSRTYSKIGDLIARHNNAKILLMRALFILANEGIVAAYHIPKADEAYGTVETYQYETNSQGVEEVKDTIKSPKSRTIIELYGPTEVKVPYRCKSQKSFGYLQLKTDHPIAYLKSIYPHIADKIEKRHSDHDSEEKAARSPSSVYGFADDEESDYDVVTRTWLRPWQFDGLSEDQEMEKNKLKKMFPKGCYVGTMGDIYVESRDESLDRYWTIGQAGLSKYIHSDPILNPIVPTQELTNVVGNLTVETIEQGIPATFADKDVLNFAAYQQQQAKPGMITPIKIRPGENARNYFYEGSRATLSKEVPVFAKQLEQMSQFLVGAFPSVFGGPSEASSRTAAEYNMSRQMALQRLSITWSLFNFWWTKVIEKSVKIFIENMVEDQRYVIPGGPGENEYVNVWIRRSELIGRVGEVEPEGSETFPVSLGQKQEILLRLLQLNNDFLNAAIFDPENRHLVAQSLSYPEMFIPGEDQRAKQKNEIREMISSGQYIPIDPLVDEDEIHISSLRNFMVKPDGLELKRTNPVAYQNLTMHLMEHVQNLSMKSVQQFGSSPPGEGPVEEPV